MKIHEILVEYRRDKTAASLGDKIVDAMARDPSLSFKDEEPEQILQFKERFKTDTDFQNYFLNRFEQGDPTSNKEYTQWIIRQYIAGKIRRLEDVGSTVRDMIERYEYAKRRNKLPAQHRDINRLDVASVYQLVKDINIDQATAAKTKQNAREIYNGPDFRVIQPLDQAASCYYGQGTQWCTASRNNNMFNEYNQNGPLYIVIPKHPNYEGEKYQIHFDSNQFTDEEDSQLAPYQLLDRFPKLRSVLDFENNFQGNKFDILAPDQWTPELLLQATEDSESARNIPDELKTPPVVASLIKNNTIDSVPDEMWTPELAVLAAKYDYFDAFPEEFAKLPEIAAILRDKRIEIARDKTYDRTYTPMLWDPWLALNAIKDGYLNAIPSKFLKLRKIAQAVSDRIPELGYMSKAQEYVTNSIFSDQPSYVEVDKQMADRYWSRELVLQAAKSGNFNAIPDQLWSPKLASQAAKSGDFDAIPDELWTQQMALLAAKSGNLRAIPDQLWTQQIAKIGADDWGFKITPKQFNSLPKS